MSEEEFPSVEIDASDNDINAMIETFIEKTFHEASVFRFKEELQKGTSFEEACRVVLFNQAALVALQEMVNKIEDEKNGKAAGQD